MPARSNPSLRSRLNEDLINRYLSTENHSNVDLSPVGRRTFARQQTYAGYSAAGRGKNNPTMQAAQGVAPIPACRWRIVEQPYDRPNARPFIRPAYRLLTGTV